MPTLCGDSMGPMQNVPCPTHCRHGNLYGACKECAWESWNTVKQTVEADIERTEGAIVEAEELLEFLKGSVVKLAEQLRRIGELEPPK